MKYVEVAYKNKNDFLEYEKYTVNDFELETLRRLPFYKTNYTSFKLVQDGSIIKTIYNGKRVCFRDVKNIVGNDARFTSVVRNMGILRYNTYTEKQEEILDEEEYLLDFDLNHYCLFTPPNNFDAIILDYDKLSMTIEEFDKDIKFNYEGYFKAISLNSLIAKNYTDNNALALSLFKNYFRMLAKSVWEIIDNQDEEVNAILIMNNNVNNIRNLFRIMEFNFKELEKESWNDIKDFLDYFRYVEDLRGIDALLLDIYQEFLKEEIENKRLR